MKFYVLLVAAYLGHALPSVMSKSLNSGTEEQATPRDCSEILAGGQYIDGIYTIYIGDLLTPLQVYCDMNTDGGGWTGFQRRVDGSEDFLRNWTDYANGFGDLRREFWLGNDNLHTITAQKKYHLLVHMSDFEGELRYAEHDEFYVGPASDKYKLSAVGSYNGTAGDSLARHLGMYFTTIDRDSDTVSTNCAAVYSGAWWYKNCHDSNLNGLYLAGSHTSYADGVNWYHWKGYYYSLKFTEMKLRPSDL